MSESPFLPPDSRAQASAPAMSAKQRRRSITLPCFVLIILWGVPILLQKTSPDSVVGFFFGALGLPILCLLMVMAYWLTQKSISRNQRWSVCAVLLLLLIIVSLVAHRSMSIMTLVMYGSPASVTAMAVWLLLSRTWPSTVRSFGMVTVSGLIGLIFCMLRVHGVTGSFAAEFDWRWNASPEERLIASKGTQPDVSGTSADLTTGKSEKTWTLQATDWPEFRGPRRNSIIHGSQLRTDWSANPPREIWRQPIGPGWSSFCVVDGSVFTQQQLGPEEQVVCLDAATGETVWLHSEPSRFEEPVAGAGPRGTPTFSDGWLYAQGAAGMLLCLDAATGRLRWRKDLAADFGAKPPEWGFSASPLLYQGLVIVFTGVKDKAVVAMRADTGELAWCGGTGALSYCSAQVSTIAGEDQILFCTDTGLLAFAPVNGRLLWQHDWPTGGVARIVQPHVLKNDDLLIGTGLGVGLRRIHVTRSGTGFSTSEVWTTTRCKPYFNDFVVLDDHLYGFDGTILMCVSLDQGDVQWRARGYGSGQALLLADQKLLLIISETGELSLVKAASDRHVVLSKFKAIDGKTWNHPVLVGHQIFVRNGAEAACFALPAE
ncbi:MAG: PQQ-binding-like beta-propeller repeat protein [Planctomycetota bacterium]